MTTIDLHGYSMEKAIDLFVSTVNQCRLMGSTPTVRFITGNGEIRQKYIQLCQEYNIDCFDYDTGNLVITFE